MTSKKYSLKKNTKTRKGGMFNRAVATFTGAKVKTFCCNSKTSAEGAWGTTSTNVGKKCERSQTGQCDVIDYKFRCFDTKDDDGGRDEINEESGKTTKLDQDGNIVEADEKCKYVAGITGKLVNTVGNVGSVASNVGHFGWQALSNSSSSGGKKGKNSNRRSSRKKRRTNKRK